MICARRRNLVVVAVVVLLPRHAFSFSKGLAPSTTARASRDRSRSHGLAKMKTISSGSGDSYKKGKILEPLAAGVRRDFSSRLPFYKSDLVDGLNAQCLATVLFLFFACLAPAVGFGGILHVATNGAMGAMEMVTSTALCGVLYALLAPQPIQLIGPMGPNLAFTISLAQLAKQYTLPLLPLYAWTGLWTSGFLLISALTSTSNIVQHLTRFTDEIFSVLISAIFLFEAVTNVARPFGDASSSASTALLTLTCAVVTFGSALVLKGLKTSICFTKSIRNNLSNFAPAIGVLLGSLVARVARLHYGILLPVLSLPATSFATTTGRPWLVPLLDLPIWARWGVALPAALLATVLLFLDQNITARLVNNPRYKMTKGRDTENVLDGMHGDMLVLSGLTALTSMLGLPWMAGATTRSAAHVRSLSVVNDKGEITKTIENRVSGAAIHALIGACVLFRGPRLLLAQVPLPVLSGVFLYLGFTSLQGLELWDRICGLFHDASVAPPTRWSNQSVKTTTLFTLVQMACVASMMRVTKSQIGVISPLLIAMLPVLRVGLLKSGLVKKESMSLLDP